MKRTLFLIAMSAGVATNARAAAFDFEAPAFPLGTTYGSPVPHAPGDVVFSQGGVDASVEVFTLGLFNGFNFAQVSGHPGPPTSFFPAAVNPTQTMTINNIALKFDFANAGQDVRGVMFDYADLGGDENLQINGLPLMQVARLKDTEALAPAGFSIAVSENPGPGGLNGTVRITADQDHTINSVLVGGQEFGLDNLKIFLPGDTDGDGDIDDADLGTAFSNFTGPVGAAGGKTVADGDTDGDGDVDDADLANAFSGFTGPLGPANVPEPTSLALLGLGVLTLASRRHR